MKIRGWYLHHKKSPNLKHGLSGSKGYRCWSGMINRCNSKSDTMYYNYGKRGITVCGRWLKIENFIKDMGERPEGMTLDRINNDGNYEPRNCRWATRKEQSRNRRDNNYYIYKGIKGHVIEWSKKTGLSTFCINDRINNRKWTVTKTLETKPMTTNKKRI